MRLRSALVVLAGFSALAAARAQPPNLVVIFCDDLGYGDLVDHSRRGRYGDVIEEIAALVEQHRAGLPEVVHQLER